MANAPRAPVHHRAHPQVIDYIRNERNILDVLHHPGIAQLHFTFQVGVLAGRGFAVVWWWWWVWDDAWSLCWGSRGWRVGGSGGGCA